MFPLLDLLGQAIDVDEYVNKLAKGNITVKDDIQVLHIFSGLAFSRQKYINRHYGRNWSL